MNDVIQPLRTHSRQAGLTLIEIAVYIALVAALTTPLMSVVLVSSQSMAEAEAVTRMQERNRALLFQLKRELRSAVGDSVVVDSVANTLRFSLPAPFNGSAATPGDIIVYGLEPVPVSYPTAPAVNGRLYRLNQTTGQRIDIAGGLDLSSSSFADSGNGIDITMTHFTTQTADGLPMTVQRAVSVVPRN